VDRWLSRKGDLVVRLGGVGLGLCLLVASVVSDAGWGLGVIAALGGVAVGYMVSLSAPTLTVSYLRWGIAVGLVLGAALAAWAAATGAGVVISVLCVPIGLILGSTLWTFAGVWMAPQTFRPTRPWDD
jgi:hypothetical protein